MYFMISRGVGYFLLGLSRFENVYTGWSKKVCLYAAFFVAVKLH